MKLSKNHIISSSGNALFHFDINSLIHGAFMSNIGGRFRVPRAFSAFVEGEDVKEALSGGAKLSDIRLIPVEWLKGNDGMQIQKSRIFESATPLCLLL